MKRKPRLCFVGNMLGRNAGYVTTQGLITADLFAAANYNVSCVSSKINRVARLSEICFQLTKNRRNFDLVLLEVYSGLSFLMADTASFLCKIFGLPLIMVLHGGNLPDFINKNPHWTNRVLRRADYLVSPSPFLAEKIGAHGFEIKVIPNVLKIELYPFRERKKLFPKFVWMRSFHWLYHPEMAISVFAEVRKIYPNATLTMAGVDKGLEPQIKQMAAEMNLSEVVNFAGFVDAEQKKRIFSESDIYLNTNRVDNMPVSVLEACAFGLPVVATNVGGLPYLINNGENGLLVENEDAREMTEAVKLLLENENLARNISRNGRKLAENSAWENVRVKWEKLFDEVLEKKTEKLASNFASTDFTTEKH